MFLRHSFAWLVAFVVPVALVVVPIRADDPEPTADPASTADPMEPVDPSAAEPGATDPSDDAGERDGSSRRSPKHEEYAASLWEFLHRESNPYEDWTILRAAPIWPLGPTSEHERTFANSRASSDPNAFEAVFVTEHLPEADAEKPSAITVRYHVERGFDPSNADWYWAHFLSDGTVVKTSVDKAPHDRPGFLTRVEDGRLWVVAIADPALPDVVRGQFPAEHVTRVGGGPGGMTLKGTSAEDLDLYSLSKPGFAIREDEGRYWVFRSGSPALLAFSKGEELADQIIRPGAGPNGETLKGPDRATLDAYEIAAPGFDVALVEDRIWVFPQGSEASRSFVQSGPPAESVTRVGEGPGGRTVRSIDAETIDAYLEAVRVAE